MESSPGEEQTAHAPPSSPLTTQRNPNFKAAVLNRSPPTPSSTSEAVRSAPPLHQFDFGNMNQIRSVVQPKTPELFNGMPSLSFTEDEVFKLSDSFKLTLVGKFSFGIPKIFEVTKMLKDCKLKGNFNVSFMDNRHVVIKLFLEEDFNTLWLLVNPNVNGTPMRFFKWSPNFSLQDDSPVVPVWISLENLPIFLFHKEALFEIGKLLGTPVKVDGYTANKSKLSQANLCIEMDVSKKHPSHLWIKTLETGTAVKVNYGKMPHYCGNCHKLGHLEKACLAKIQTGNHTTQPEIPDLVRPRPLYKPGYPYKGQQIDENEWIQGSRRNGRHMNYGSRGGRAYIGGRGGRGRGDFQAWQPRMDNFRSRTTSILGDLSDGERDVNVNNSFSVLGDVPQEEEVPTEVEEVQVMLQASVNITAMDTEPVIPTIVEGHHNLQVKEHLSERIQEEEEEPSHVAPPSGKNSRLNPVATSPEFEPIILERLRRKSLGNLTEVPFPTDLSSKNKNLPQHSLHSRGLSEGNTEEESEEEEDDWSSSDEIYLKMFSDKARKSKNSPQAPTRRSTRITGLSSGFKAINGKKKGGKKKDTSFL